MFEKTYAMYKAKKNIKSHGFWILKKKHKNFKKRKSKVLETTQSCKTSIKLLRPYFNQQFYIMLHV